MTDSEDNPVRGLISHSASLSNNHSKATSRVGVLVKIHNLAGDDISEGFLRFT